MTSILSNRLLTVPRFWCAGVAHRLFDHGGPGEAPLGGDFPGPRLEHAEDHGPALDRAGVRVRNTHQATRAWAWSSARRIPAIPRAAAASRPTPGLMCFNVRVRSRRPRSISSERPASAYDRFVTLISIPGEMPGPILLEAGEGHVPIAAARPRDDRTLQGG